MGRARGCEAFWLATETDNTPALALYRKLGGTAETFVGFDWDQVP
jgi:ribosomal protein S18 acetylase RimI-like enzyme